MKTLQWYEEADAALTSLKRALCSASILTYPRFDRDFVLEVDASLKGPGACLSQIHAPFDIEVRYRSGKSNQCADALSRCPANMSYEETASVLHLAMDRTTVPKGQSAPNDESPGFQVWFSEWPNLSERDGVLYRVSNDYIHGPIYQLLVPYVLRVYSISPWTGPLFPRASRLQMTSRLVFRFGSVNGRICLRGMVYCTGCQTTISMVPSISC